ncbi:MAG TPA: hypothetical protein VGC99_22340 [Candidatus Tectomicrobia bacterium]
MSQNAKALLLASTLILVSAIGVMYLNTERAAPTKQATMTSGELMTKRVEARASASVYGLPARVAPISMPGRVSPSEPSTQPGFSNAVKGTLIGGDVRSGTSATIGSEFTHKIEARASWHND